MFVKILVGGVLIGFMFIAFWFVMWQPLENQIVALNQQIATEKQKYQQYQQEAQNLEKWEAAKVAFQNVLAQLHQTPASIKEFVPTFLKDIEKLAASERAATGDSTFHVTSITPGAVQVQNASATPAGGGKKGAQPAANAQAAGGAQPAPSAQPGQQPMQVASGTTVVQLNFTGRFDTIVDFLQQLGNFKLNKLVTIQRITLSPQNPKPGLSPTLSVEMPFQVYMLGGG